MITTQVIVIVDKEQEIRSTVDLHENRIPSRFPLH